MKKLRENLTVVLRQNTVMNAIRSRDGSGTRTVIASPILLPGRLNEIGVVGTVCFSRWRYRSPALSDVMGPGYARETL
jgi:hypothetical protein